MEPMRRLGLVRGDLDGFFGLFVDNLLQLMLIDVLCRLFCGFDERIITGRILPGAAVSIFVGNAYYAWQARRLARATGRDDVTALPYGINTPSLLAYIFLVMKPVYDRTGDAELAWRAGLLACVGSGVIEVAGAFVGDWLRRHTPRAALLSALAGIAITFIAMGFVFQLFATPLIAVPPMLIVLVAYAGRLRLPWGLPGGLVAVAVGCAAAWGLLALRAWNPALDWVSWTPPTVAYTFAWHVPQPTVGDLWAVLRGDMLWQFLAVIFPMGLFNVIGSLQNLESAEAAGDCYPTRSSLLVNGVGTLTAAALGSAFPTTIYIGHPGWKAMGARWTYSLLNGLVIGGLCLVGGVTLVLRVVPLEATLGILLWIGIIITAQAFEAVPARHTLAVAIGLIPSVAAWALQVLIEPSLRVGGRTLADSVQALERSGVYLHGVIALSQGFLISAMVLSAVLVHVIEHRFLRAAWWLLAAAGLSMVGLIHAYDLTQAGVVGRLGWCAAPQFAIAYAVGAALLAGLRWSRWSGSER